MQNDQETNKDAENAENNQEKHETGNELPVPEGEVGETIEGLKQALAGKDGEIETLNRSLSEAREALEKSATGLAEVVNAYRDILVRANPGVLPEMITGESIGEINSSLANARSVMEKAKRAVEADAARARVPAGAPQRVPPDVSAFSAREKIRYSLEK